MKSFNPQSSKLDILYYEILMLNKTVELYWAENNLIKKNSMLESFLIHARNLIDFLECNKIRKDDLVCSNFKDTNKIDINLDHAKFAPEVKEKINKHLSHMTATRINEKINWVDVIFSIRLEINNHIETFLNRLPSGNFPTKKGTTFKSFVDLIKK